MTLVPFTTCCLLLDVDPKTLRLWLTSARLSCTRSPTDTRLKCLTPLQLHQLAELHGRFLPDPLPGEANPPACSPVSTPASAQAASPLESARHFPASTPAPEADLRHQLTLLQAHVASLQEHVTQLALALVRQQQWQWEQHAAPCLPPLPSPVANSTPAPPAGRIAVMAKPSALPESDRPRSRSRALPLIEYGADGSYVVISPTQGVLALTPDSAEWFDWLHLPESTRPLLRDAQIPRWPTYPVLERPSLPAWPLLHPLPGPDPHPHPGSFGEHGRCCSRSSDRPLSSSVSPLPC